MNKNKVFFGLAALVSLTLAGCAAQDAHRTYSRVETKLSKATAQIEPNDASYKEANQALVLGRAQLLAGRYDLAIRSFREADRLTDLVQQELAAKKAEEIALAEQKAAEQRAAEEKAKEAEAAAVAAAAIDPEQVQGLAAQPSETTPTPLTDAKGLDHLVAEAPKPSEAGETHAPAKAKPVVKTPAPKPKPSATVSTVVVAPAKPEQKKVPVVEEKAVASPKDNGQKRRSLGAVAFVVKDASIIEESMTSLNQTAKFLLDNPSRSLALMASYSPDEPKGIADQRLESVKAYLVGKGVPEDQILFDEDRKRGSAEVLLFEVED